MRPFKFWQTSSKRKLWLWKSPQLFYENGILASISTVVQAGSFNSWLSYNFNNSAEPVEVLCEEGVLLSRHRPMFKIIGATLACLICGMCAAGRLFCCLASWQKSVGLPPFLHFVWQSPVAIGTFCFMHIKWKSVSFLACPFFVVKSSCWMPWIFQITQFIVHFWSNFLVMLVKLLPEGSFGSDRSLPQLFLQKLSWCWHHQH